MIDSFVSGETRTFLNDFLMGRGFVPGWGCVGGSFVSWRMPSAWPVPGVDGVYGSI